MGPSPRWGPPALPGAPRLAAGAGGGTGGIIRFGGASMDDERRDGAGQPADAAPPGGGPDENPNPNPDPKEASPVESGAGGTEPEEDEWGQVRPSAAAPTAPAAGGKTGSGARRGPLVVGVVALLAVLGAVAAWFWLDRAAPPPEPEPEPVAETPAAEPTPEPEEPPLPELDDSDPFLRDLFTAVAESPEAVAWLLGTDLARHAAIAVDNVADGQSPRRALAALTPVDDFRVVGEGEEQQVAPASFARYDSLAEGIAGADMTRVAEAAVRSLPLLETAYAELGRPDRTFREALTLALDRLLTAPVPELPILIRERTLRYEYRDPRLQDLDEASKHLVRLGPENQRRVQEALARFASAFRARAPRGR